jgi:hypothetical protein
LPFERKTVQNLIVVQRAHGARFVRKLRLGEIQQFFVEGEVDDGVRLQAPYVSPDLGRRGTLAGIFAGESREIELSRFAETVAIEQ